MKKVHFQEETHYPKAEDEAVHEDNRLDALITSIGQFGRFQINNYILLCLPFMCVAIYNMSFIFTASPVNHRCIIGQCDTENSSYMEPFLNFTIPQYYGEWAQCEQYEGSTDNGGYCSPLNFNRSHIVHCKEGYKFKSNENTISRDFNIFCSDQWRLSMVGTINNLGQFVAVVTGGYLSDRYGRKTVLVISGALTAFSGIAQSHTTNYGSFLFFEFLNLVLSSPLHPTAFLLAMEMVNPESRVAVITGLTIAQSVVLMGLGPLAGNLLDWRLLLRFIYTPALLHLIFICVLPESVRWLLSQLREQEAVEILQKAARCNKRTIPHAQLDKLVQENRRLVAQTKAPGGQYTMRQIYHDLGLRIAQCCAIWLCARFIDLGLIINLTQLNGNKFTNYTIMAFIKLPAIGITTFLMDRIGRRWTMFYLLCTCAVILVVCRIIGTVFPTVFWSLYFIAVMAVMGTLHNLIIFVSEMAPTSYRTRIFSFCLMVSLIGSMLAPFTILLVRSYKNVPQYLFILLAVVSAVITLYLPETAHKVLPSTLEEACAIDKSLPTEPTKTLDNKSDVRIAVL